MGYTCAVIVHTWVDQLLPQLLMEQFDTLPSQYRLIGSTFCMKKFDYEKNILDKMTAM